MPTDRIFLINQYKIHCACSTKTVYCDRNDVPQPIRWNSMDGLELTDARASPQRDRASPQKVTNKSVLHRIIIN